MADQGLTRRQALGLGATAAAAFVRDSAHRPSGQGVEGRMQGSPNGSTGAPVSIGWLRISSVIVRICSLAMARNRTPAVRSPTSGQ